MAGPDDLEDGFDAEIEEVDIEDEIGDDTGEGAEERESESDAGEDGGQEGDAAEEERGKGDVAPARETRAPKRGANEVIRETKRRAKQAEQEREDARREAADLRRRIEALDRQTAERTQAQTAAQEAERLALMTAEEKLDYYRAKDREERQREIGQIRWEAALRDDKREFRELCRDNDLYAKVAARVEAKFEEQAKQGRFVERAVLAKLELAEMVLANKTRGVGTQKRKAEESVRRQKTTPVRSGSGVPTNRGKLDPNSREARLKRLDGFVF